MNLSEFDCFSAIPITNINTGTQIKLIKTTIKELWKNLQEILSIENSYAPYSDRLNPIFLQSAEILFQDPLEQTCKRKAIASFDRCRDLAIAGQSDDLFCELLVAQYWLVLGASIVGQTTDLTIDR